MLKPPKIPRPYSTVVVAIVYYPLVNRPEDSTLDQILTNMLPIFDIVRSPMSLKHTKKRQKTPATSKKLRVKIERI